MNICAIIIIVNMTPFWSSYDQKTLVNSKKRCYTLYKMPCVKKFIKKSKRNYNVICGDYNEN